MCKADSAPGRAPDSPDSTASTRLTTNSQGLRGGRISRSSSATCSEASANAASLLEGKAEDGAASFDACFELTGRVLGRGVSCSVQEAVCRNSGEHVAVKTLAVECGPSGDRARREAS